MDFSGQKRRGTSAVLPFNGVWLLLFEGGDPTADKPDITFVPPDPDQDRDASHETLKAWGAQFLTPPYDWGGEIRCFFADPDGHLSEISQLTGALQ